MSVDFSDVADMSKVTTVLKWTIDALVKKYTCLIYAGMI